MSDIKSLLQDKLKENHRLLLERTFLYYIIFTKKWMEKEVWTFSKDIQIY